MTTRVTESSVERLLEGLAALVEERQAVKSQSLAPVTKAVSATYANYGHGPGVFTPPMDPNVLNAMQLPRQGLLDLLPEYPTDLETPLYGIISGQSASTDSTPPADDCGTWGSSGYTAICRQYQVLGTQGITSQPVNLNRMGRYVDRADFHDYQLIGNPLDNSITPDLNQQLPGAGTPNDFLNYEVAKIIRELEIEDKRRFAPDLWTANPATAADAYHTAWFRGMQLQVNTGYQDAIAGTACNIVDSTIIPFASNPAGNNVATTAQAGSDLVRIIAEVVFTLEQRATEAGLDPVEWKFVMTREAFRAVTEVWPCSYLTNRCLTASSSNPNVVMASDQLAMREEMRSGRFLWVDAKQIPVIIDNTLPQTQASGAAGAGTFTSDIWYLPFTVRGNFPVLYRTFFNYRGPGAASDAIQKFGPLMYGSSVSPNGKYLFSMDKSYDCFRMKVTSRPGLVLRTPYLAARITNVAYKTLMVTPSWNPSAPSYYLNGGVSTGTGPSYYKPTTNG